MADPVLAPAATASAADILLQAEGIVRDFCGWHIAPSQSTTVTIEHEGGPELLLPTRFATAVSTVTHLGTTITGWRLRSPGILQGAYFPCGPIVVAYTSGYAANAVPPAVTRVVQAIAQRITANPTSGSRRIGPFSESAAEMLPDEKDELAPYCEPPV